MFEVYCLYLPWFNTLVKSQYILTLKNHQSSNVCDDTLCSLSPPPPPPYLGVAVLFLTL